MLRAQSSAVTKLCAVSGTMGLAVLVACQPVWAAQQSLGAGAQIAWNQEIGSDADLASYTFVLYVDGAPTPLVGASCTRAAPPTTYECIAPLPPLPPGVHSLQVAAARGVGAASFESGQSSPVLVSVPGAGGSPELLRAEDSRSTRPAAPVSNGLAIEQVASGLLHPTDLAFASDGLLFIAERAGLVRVLENGRWLPAAALRIDDLQQSANGALLSIAVDPQFARNGLVYLVYVSETPEGAVIYRLARFRYARGVFGQGVTLLDAVPAAPGNLAASIRFGPDGKLYVAFGDANGRRDDLGSYNGKVLRLNPDGTTPRDQRSASPVYVAGLFAPRAMAWRSGENDLWIVDAPPDGTRLVQASLSATGGAAVHALAAEGADAASIAFYSGDLLPELRGDLLIPVREDAPLLRVRAEPAPRAGVTFEGWELLDVGAARVVAVSPSGEIYLGIADALVKVVPGK